MNEFIIAGARQARNAFDYLIGRLHAIRDSRTPIQAAGKCILVTGATGGIGETTAANLVQAGACVLVHGRSDERIQATLERLRPLEGNGGKAIGYRADLSDPAQVDRLIAEVRGHHGVLDGLLNNAALGYEVERQVTAAGVERVWAVNVLAPWQITQGLAPLLAKAPGSRVINVVSGLVQEIGEDISLADNYDPLHAYARSKQALIVLTRVLADELGRHGISAFAMDPGTLDTRIAAGFPANQVNGISASPLRAGAAFARLLTEASRPDRNGRLYNSVRRRVRLPKQARDERFRADLAETVRRQVQGPHR